MDFSLNEEQKLVKDTAARFADEVLKPKAAHFDQTHEHPKEPATPWASWVSWASRCRMNTAARAWTMCPTCWP
jgi:alkylation response protein AidB-like acyl-CoA dehydrogenase